MSYKIEHKFFIHRWELDLAKYNFAYQNKIKGFRAGKIDRSLMAIIDIRYKDHIFDSMIEQSAIREVREINNKNPVISYTKGEVKASDNNEGWDVNIIVEVQNTPDQINTQESKKENDDSQIQEQEIQNPPIASNNHSENFDKKPETTNKKSRKKPENTPSEK